jgi:hypothetical protein
MDYETKLRMSRNNLASLFRARDEAAKALTEIDRLIALDGREYWKLQGYTVMPRLEKLRIAILGE